MVIIIQEIVGEIGKQNTKQIHYGNDIDGVFHPEDVRDKEALKKLKEEMKAREKEEKVRKAEKLKAEQEKERLAREEAKREEAVLKEQWEEERKKRQIEFESKFDENGICKNTKLLYDENFFNAKGINIVTNTKQDVRDFDALGRCIKNKFRDFDIFGFKQDGTHYQTGERFYNGYNAYGVDENGKDRKGYIPKDITIAREYIKAIFISTDPDSRKNI